MAVRVLHSMSQDELNWYRESSYWMRVSDDKTMINTATRRGLEKGMKKGLKQGRKIGIQEGRK
jgi:predicted transposase YdaD